MKRCDSSCVHNLAKLESATSDASPVYQLFGNDQPVWTQSCSNTLKREQRQRSSAFLRDLMAIAARLVPALADDCRLEDQPVPLAVFWAHELPAAMVRCCNECISSRSRDVRLSLAAARAMPFIGNAEERSNRTQRNAVLCGDETCHLLFHLLDVALANSLLDPDMALDSVCSAATILAHFDNGLAGGQGLWQAIVNFGGLTVAQNRLSCSGQAAAADIAQLAVDRLHNLAPATQMAVVALVQMLRSKIGHSMDEVVERLVGVCGSASAALKRNVGQMVLAIYGTGVAAPPAIAVGARSLAGDWDPHVRKLWQEISASITIQLPQYPVEPYMALRQGLCNSKGMAAMDSQAVSRCAGMLTAADATSVVAAILESDKTDGCGLSDSAVDTIGALYRAAGLGKLAAANVQNASAIVIASAAHRISADDDARNNCQKLISRLVDTIRARSKLEFTLADAGGLFWVLELLFHLCTADGGDTMAELLRENADVRLLLLRAATACSNIGVVVYVCQVAMSAASGSSAGAVTDGLCSTAAWPVVAHMLDGDAGDAVDAMIRRDATAAIGELAALSLTDTDGKKAESRLRLFDGSTLSPMAASLEELRFERSLFNTIENGKPMQPRVALVRRPSDLVLANLFVEPRPVFVAHGIVARTPPTIQITQQQSAAGGCVSWPEMSDLQRLLGIKLCLARGFVRAEAALSALQSVTVDQLDQVDMQHWRALCAAAAITVAYDTGAVDVTLVEGQLSLDTTAAAWTDICFALPANFAVTASIGERLRLQVDERCTKAKEALLYFAANQADPSTYTDGLYSQVLCESTGAIRFTASGTFDVASQLIAHISSSPLHAPQLAVDRLSASAVEQLAVYIPQLVALLSFQAHAGQHSSGCLASESALRILELLAQSAPDTVVLYAVVASDSVPASSGSGRRVARLLQLFDPEQIASIRAFLACVGRIAVLPLERVRLAWAKAKSAHTKAVAAIQLGQLVDPSAIDESLLPVYQALDEYPHPGLLPTPAEQGLIDAAPRIRRLLDRLRYSSSFKAMDAQKLRRRLDSAWADILKLLNTPALLSLAEVCPQITQLSGAIPIPMLAHPARPLYFDGAGSTVRTIGSKTRPKHLMLHFHTSEGAAVKEQYIFKGNEDLRIDESVMQTFVRLNRVMGSRSQRGAAELSQPPAGSTLAVYNVVPTGAHGGMIQVVDSASSLFAMYSQHSAQHTSESAASVAHKRSMGDAGVPVSNRAAPPGLRQLFADHGQRILAASGLPSTLPFEKWPQVVAEQVFASLRATALPSLLHRQLMRAAPSSAHLLISTRRLVSSIGTASAAGYAVGLGDRHLDNLLVDLNTAQLVHIDFNVCYDFGGVSQIPEQVPFRMTPILAYLCGSPHPDQLANTPFAMSRGFANSFAALLQLARMDRCALVGAITARCLFSPFMEWCWIEEQRLQDKQQRIRTPTAQLPLPQCLCADAGLLANLESASAEEYIQATGLCPPQAFWSHDGMLREQSLTEAPSGWRLARGAVDRMRARLSFSGSLVGSQTEQVQLQTRALWEAATATPRLARMFAGWAPWV